MKPFFLLVRTVSFLFLLTACGGGGGSTVLRPMDPLPPTVDTQTAFAQAGQRPALELQSSRATLRGQLQQSAPAFGSVAMNLYSPGLSPVQSADTTFTGNRFTLNVRRENGTGFTLDTDRHYAEVVDDSSVTTNSVTARPFASGYVADVTETRAVIAGASVEWNNADVADYLAGGYWLTFDLTTQALDMGAFIDGTDYPTPNNAAYTLRVTGTATYRGRAGGLYVAASGSDTPIPGATQIGEYTGRATLTANFGTMQMSGRVDQIDGSGLVELADGTQYVSVPESTDIEMVFQPVPINQNGTFWGNNVEFTSQVWDITSSSGSWAGQFSTVEDTSGNPRAAAGTNTGYLESAGGSRAVLTGAFYGTTERFE